MSPTTLYREGTDLDELLAELDTRYPGKVRVVEVTHPREGGVMGFFAKQRVGVRYRLVDGVPVPETDDMLTATDGFAEEIRMASRTRTDVPERTAATAYDVSRGVRAEGRGGIGIAEDGFGPDPAALRRALARRAAETDDAATDLEPSSRSTHDVSRGAGAESRGGASSATVPGNAASAASAVVVGSGDTHDAAASAAGAASAALASPSAAADPASADPGLQFARILADIALRKASAPAADTSIDADLAAVVTALRQGSLAASDADPVSGDTASDDRASDNGASDDAVALSGAAASGDAASPAAASFTASEFPVEATPQTAEPTAGDAPTADGGLSDTTPAAPRRRKPRAVPKFQATAGALQAGADVAGSALAAASAAARAAADAVPPAPGPDFAADALAAAVQLMGTPTLAAAAGGRRTAELNWPFATALRVTSATAPAAEEPSAGDAALATGDAVIAAANSGADALATGADAAAAERAVTPLGITDAYPPASAAIPGDVLFSSADAALTDLRTAATPAAMLVDARTSAATGTPAGSPVTVLAETVPVAAAPTEAAPSIAAVTSAVWAEEASSLVARRIAETDRAVGAVATSRRLELRRTLIEIGVPVDSVPDDADHAYAAVETLVHDLAPAPALPQGAGQVVVIAGPGRDAVAAADALAATRGMTFDSIWSFGCPAGLGTWRVSTHDSVLTSVAEAREVARSHRESASGTTLVVIATDAPSWGVDPVAMIDALTPDSTWAVVDATRKPGDTRRSIRTLGHVDAIAVTNAEQSGSPATVWDLGLPIAMVDGRPSSAATWAVLLVAKLSELEESACSVAAS